MVVQIVGFNANQSNWVLSMGGSAPQPGDLVVYLVQSRSTTGVLPTSVTGLGATWTNVGTTAAGHVGVWIGTGATALGDITNNVTGTLNRNALGAAAWRLRGADAYVSSLQGDYANGTVTIPAVPAGPGQIVLSISRGAADAGTTPDIASWTVGTTSSQTAYASRVPAVTELHSLVDTGTPVLMSQLVLGTPAPAAVTALTVTSYTDSTLTATWEPPPATAPVTGYTVQLDAGPVVDVGTALTYELTALTPATTYTVTVRAYNVTGPGPATTAPGTTLEPPPPPPPPSGTPRMDYHAHVRLGSHVWDVDSGDPATYGPILPLSFGWAVPEDSSGFPAQPDPDTLSLELVTTTADDMAGVDIDTPAVVSITPTGWDRPLATFVGRVADLEAAPTDTGGLSWRLLAVGYTADLGGAQVGAGDWPSESGAARAARILAEARVPGWTADPIGCTFEARGPQPVTARAALAATLDAAVTAVGTQYGPGRRVLVHPRVDAAGTLDPAAPFAGAEVLRQVDHIDTVTAGLINRRTTWRRTRLLDATHVTIDHPGGPTTYGDPRGPAYPPQTLPITDPEEWADLVLDTTPGFRWLTGDALRFELWAEDAEDSAVLDWFYRDPASEPFPWSGRAVVVESIAQAPDGSTTYAGMLAGARLILEPGGRLVVEFRLRPEVPAYSTVTYRWMDEPPTAPWTAEPAGATWFALRTTPRP